MMWELLFGQPQPGPFVIYRIVHLPSSATYVGKTGNWPRRLSAHLRELRVGIHSNAPLQALANESGIDALSFEVWWRAPADWTNERVRGAEDAAMLSVLRMGQTLLNVLRPAAHPGLAFTIGPGGRWRTGNPHDPDRMMFEVVQPRR